MNTLALLPPDAADTQETQEGAIAGAEPTIATHDADTDAKAALKAKQDADYRRFKATPRGLLLDLLIDAENEAVHAEALENVHLNALMHVWHPDHPSVRESETRKTQASVTRHKLYRTRQALLNLHHAVEMLLDAKAKVRLPDDHAFAVAMADVEVRFAELSERLKEESTK